MVEIFKKKIIIIERANENYLVVTIYHIIDFA